jgi:hypothetical protein
METAWILRPEDWRGQFPSRRTTEKLVRLPFSYWGLTRWVQTSLSNDFPLLSVARTRENGVIGQTGTTLSTWWEHLGSSLLALWPRCLVLLYQLRACNLKTTLSVRGSKVTKRACRARGRIPVEAWMGTFDEVDFLSPYISCETYVIRREGASKALFWFVCFVLFFVLLLLWSLSP